jgi:hypothetical protein
LEDALVINQSGRVGVWLTPDGEVGVPDLANPYRYVGNNPTNFTDPSGLVEFDPLAYFKERVKSVPGRVLDGVTNWAAQKVTAPVQYVALTAKGAWDGVQGRVQGTVDQAAATVTRVEMEVAVARMAAPFALRQLARDADSVGNTVEAIAAAQSRATLPPEIQLLEDSGIHPRRADLEGRAYFAMAGLPNQDAQTSTAPAFVALIKAVTGAVATGADVAAAALENNRDDLGRKVGSFGFGGLETCSPVALPATAEYVIHDVLAWLGEKTTGKLVTDEELAAIEERLPDDDPIKMQKKLHDIAERGDPVSAARGRAVMPLIEIVVPFLLEGGAALADWIFTEARTAYLLGRMASEGLEVEAADAGRLANQGRVAAEAIRTQTCFVAGTPLRTPAGEKVVEQFKRGDLLLSRREDGPDAPVEIKAVEEVFVRVAAVVEIRVRGRVIGTTAEHPFYVRGAGWRCAGELRPGEELSSHDGAWSEVETVGATGKVVTVYNVRVADYHTYFVGGEEWGFSVWAHNLSCDFGRALRALGHDIPDSQIRAIFGVAMRGDPDAATAIGRLRGSLSFRGINLTAEQEATVFREALRGTPLDGVDPTPHVVQPAPVGRPLTPDDSPLLKRYLSLKPGEDGGRWGGYEVRQLNHRLASELEAQKYEVMNGAGRRSEESFRALDGKTVHVDIKATKGTETVRIQTVTTFADGITLDPTEAANAARILAKFPDDKLILVSKQTGKVIPYP